MPCWRLPHPEVTASDGSDTVERLTAEQAGFTERAIEFIDEMDALYFERIAQLNGTTEIEILDFPTEYAAHNVKVARGGVVEKAGRMRIVPKKPKADFQRKRLWSRFFLGRRAPEIAEGRHAARSIHVALQPGTARSAIGGWVDVLPGASSPEDLATLKRTMDAVFDRHGKDPEPHRKMSCEGSPGEGQRRREPACVGGSFYGRDMMAITEQNFRFMTEAYREFLITYLGLIEKNKDAPYSAEDLARQDYMRRNWLEDRFFLRSVYGQRRAL